MQKGINSLESTRAFFRDVHAVLQVPSQDDVIELDVGKHVSVQWLIEGEAELSETILQLADKLPTTTQVFLGLESMEVKKLKRLLQDQLNIHRSKIQVSSYWNKRKRS